MSSRTTRFPERGLFGPGQDPCILRDLIPFEYCCHSSEDYSSSISPA
uniref:Uncharacterized protein n=1 Tax=Anguilla anguilla TaxID=7936 RepID=A0A0E9TS42_ANGAN